MSKTSSGLFSGTAGAIAILAEDYYDRYLRDGNVVLDVKGLPGAKGMDIPHRLSSDQMMYLTEKYGVEFAQVYELGQGKNGGGGRYLLFSGSVSTVKIPLKPTLMLIDHTHPSGTPWPSEDDKNLMKVLAALGSPQRTSAIVPKGKKDVLFTSKGVRHD